MEYAKLTIKPLSPFISKLQSDTIFGHFAWGVRFIFGKKRLIELLTDFKENPFIIFSDGFLKDTLPKPFLKPFSLECKDIELAKKYKKSSFVDKNIIFKNIQNLNDEIIFKNFIQNKKIKKDIKEQITQKNSVNRVTSYVTEGLYTIKESFLNEEYDIYFAYQTIKKEEIEEIFDFISKRGFGKDKSTGKGKFSFSIDWDFREKEFFQRGDKNFYLNLSTMFYNEKNMKLYYGKTITKFPKAGGYYASSEPFKNPIVMFIPGSTFIVGDGILGDAKDNVYNKQKHYQNGYSIGIYFDGE